MSDFDTQMLKDIKFHAISNIKRLIDERAGYYQSPFLSPSALFGILEDLGATGGESMESNGWEWDWWDYYFLDNLKISCSGCGFTGGSAISIEIITPDE